MLSHAIDGGFVHDAPARHPESQKPITVLNCPSYDPCSIIPSCTNPENCNPRTGHLFETSPMLRYSANTRPMNATYAPKFHIYQNLNGAASKLTARERLDLQGPARHMESYKDAGRGRLQDLTPDHQVPVSSPKQGGRETSYALNGRPRLHRFRNERLRL